MIPAQRFCAVLLGRHGDLIQLAPAFAEIARVTGQAPLVIVARDYAHTLDGCSYVRSYPLNVGWYEGVPQARAVAEALGHAGRVIQWWGDTPDKIELVEGISKHGHITLQSHGHNWGVDTRKHPNYTLSMWGRAGFSRDDYYRLPLVFDRRDYQREGALAKATLPKGSGKPVVLTHWTGNSSPFPYVPEVQNALTRKLGRDFQFVDLGRVQATRIFDVLGLMDRVAGMVLSDSAPLHLAAASPTPYVAYTIGGWTGSLPKGNVALHVCYDDAKRRLDEMLATVASWRGDAHLEQLRGVRPGHAQAPGGGPPNLGSPAMVRASHP